MLRKLIRCCTLLGITLLLIPTQAQNIPDNIIPTAITAAQNALPELGQPTSWNWQRLLEINESSLGCPLVQGQPLAAPITAYRVTLEFENTTYEVRVSADASRVQLCDERFPGVGAPTATPDPAQPVQPTPDAAACSVALRNASVLTYPSPVVGTSNFTLTDERTYTVAERTADDLWYRVVLPEQPALQLWVPIGDITLTGTNCATLPIFDNQDTACQLTPAGEFTNVRSQPNTDADQIDTIFENSVHAVVGRNADSSWYLIQQGWVAASVAVLSGDCSGVPVVDTIVEEGSTSTGSSQFLCLEDSDLYLPTRIQEGVGTARVQVGGIPNRIRAEPSIEAEFLGNAQPGRTFDEIIEGPACNQGYTWWRVEIDGIVGWTAESNGATDEYYIEPIEGFEVEPEIAPGRVLTGSEGFIRDLAFNEEGSILASADGASNIVQLWSLETDERTTPTPQHEGEVFRVLFHPDGTLISADVTGDIRFWNIEEVIELAPIEGVINAQFGSDVEVSPDGSLLGVTGCAQFGTERACGLGEVVLLDINTGEPVWIFQLHEDAAYGMAFSPNGEIFASRSTDGVRLREVATGDPYAQLSAIPADNLVQDVVFSPDGDTLAFSTCVELIVRDGAASCQRGEVAFWDVMTGELISTLEHDNDIMSIAYHPDGDLLAYSTADGLVILWDVASETIVETFEGHTNLIRVLAFSPDGALLASGSDDETIRLWEIEAAEQAANG